MTGSETSYTVRISGITGTGTLGIAIAANTATDKAGNSGAQPPAPRSPWITPLRR